MKWMSHAESSPVEIIMAGGQTTPDLASSSSINRSSSSSSTRAAVEAAVPTESVAAAPLVQEPPEKPPPVDWGELSLDPDPTPWYAPELATTTANSKPTSSSGSKPVHDQEENSIREHLLDRGGSLPKQSSRRTRTPSPLLKSVIFFWLSLVIVFKLGTSLHISTGNLPCPSTTKNISMFDSSKSDICKPTTNHHLPTSKH